MTTKGDNSGAEKRWNKALANLVKRGLGLAKRSPAGIKSVKLIRVVQKAMVRPKEKWMAGRVIFEHDLPVLQSRVRQAIAEQGSPLETDIRKIKLDKRLFASTYVDAVYRSFWADYELWGMVAKGSSGRLIAQHVKKKYRLVVPSLPNKIWRALVNDKPARETFFFTLGLQSWRILSPNPEYHTAGVKEELRRKRFGKVLSVYPTDSGLDHKALMASQQFSKIALMAIKDSASRLLEDAQWCLDNPHEVLPTLVRNPVGNQWGKHASLMEELVELLRESPSATNGQIAKDYCKRAKAEGRSVKQESIRLQVPEAKLLARDREGIPVKFHKQN